MTHKIIRKGGAVWSTCHPLLSTLSLSPVSLSGGRGGGEEAWRSDEREGARSGGRSVAGRGVRPAGRRGARGGPSEEERSVGRDHRPPRHVASRGGHRRRICVATSTFSGGDGGLVVEPHARSASLQWASSGASLVDELVVDRLARPIDSARRSSPSPMDATTDNGAPRWRLTGLARSFLSSSSLDSFSGFR